MLQKMKMEIRHQTVFMQYNNYKEGEQFLDIIRFRTIPFPTILESNHIIID